MEAFREARALYDIRSVLGLEGRRDWLVCPLPQHVHYNYTASFSIYYDGGVQKWKCHGNCGLYGDVIDLVGYMCVANYNPQSGEDVKRALGFLDQKYEIKPVPTEIKAPVLNQEAYKIYLPAGADVIDYARARGLSIGTLRHFSVGQSRDFMTIPTFHNGRLQGIKFRNTSPTSGRLRFWSESGSKSGLFNYDDVYHTEMNVLILKGEIPVMLCTQHGLKSCAPTAGENSDASVWLPIVAFSRHRVVVGDNDRDPDVRKKMRKAARRRADALLADLYYPPEQYKDIDEWMLADDSAVVTIQGWLEE